MENVLLHGDCLELMKEIPDGAVDLILCDPPFGITDAPFDKIVDIPSMWAEFKRVTKQNAAIVLFSQLPFAVDLINANRKMYRYEWIWQKTNGVGFLNAKKMPLRAHENILVFYQKLPTYNPQFTYGKPYKSMHWGKNSSANWNKYADFLTVSEDGRRYPLDVQLFAAPNFQQGGGVKYHPQQKPLNLLEYLIRTYTNEGELVLDATMGSGSTCVAAVNIGRRYIGIEKDDHFYEIACKRVAEATEKAEAQLFTDAV